MLVKLWMQTELITIHPADTIAQAGQLMTEHRIRRLPVVDDEDRLLGILSREDVKQATPSEGTLAGDQPQALTSQTPVAAFMATDPVTCMPTEPLEKVAEIMRRQKIGGIPVIDGEKLVGIITESDVLAAFAEILGGKGDGFRLEIAIDFNHETLYEVIDLFRQYDMEIETLTLCNVFSEKSRLLTIRCRGEDIEPLSEALWDGGFKINSLLGR